jgi:hypothetical protein
VRTAVPAGTLLEIDPVLKPGVARIGLRLGEIAIDPAQGIAKLLFALRDQGDA